jgi:hypothetical protein
VLLTANVGQPSPTHRLISLSQLPGVTGSMEGSGRGGRETGREVSGERETEEREWMEGWKEGRVREVKTESSVKEEINGAGG